MTDLITKTNTILVKSAGNPSPGKVAYVRKDRIATTKRWSEEEGTRPRVGYFLSRADGDGFAQVLTLENF
jgi:hypothetical protein